MIFNLHNPDDQPSDSGAFDFFGNDHFNFDFLPKGQDSTNFRDKYIHGRGPRERQRLDDQGQLFGDEIHKNLNFGSVKNLLEVGCGSGVQTIRLLRTYPHMHITCVEIDKSQIRALQKQLVRHGFENRVTIIEGDITDKEAMEKIAAGKCDAAFVCFTLEHISNPEEALRQMSRLLAPNSRLVFREVNNKSLQLEPEDPCLRTLAYWKAMADLQKDLGGDSNIGFRLADMLRDQGFTVKKDKPNDVKAGKYAVDLRKDLVDFLYDLMEGMNSLLLKHGKVKEGDLEKVYKELTNFQANRESIFKISFQAIQAFSPGENVEIDYGKHDLN